MCKHCDSDNETKNDIIVTQEFWFWSIFDGDVFHFDGNVTDLEKIFGKTQYELVYDTVELNAAWHISKWSYKSGCNCHICNKDLFAWVGKSSFYNDVHEVCASISEKVVVIWPIEDSWGYHKINVCENCIKKYMEAFIIEFNN